MPVSGLPNALEILLKSLMEASSLRSWNIFDDKGIVCVKLRFSNSSPPLNSTPAPEDNEVCHAACNKATGTFKRKSLKQVERDRRRMEDHQQRRILTRSQSAQLARSEANDDGSPEDFRCYNDDSCQTDEVENSFKIRS